MTACVTREVHIQHSYDRAAEDLGNIVGLEHVNVRIPDQQAATAFYVAGLGLTRDPYLMTGVDNMWINVGRSQFHLPTGAPQLLRGHVGIVVPDREALLRRLDRVAPLLRGTCFDFRERDGYVETVSPWGNRIHCHAPDPRFGPVILGMPYVEFRVPMGRAEGIARFYREVLGAPSFVVAEAGGALARVAVGASQELVFREASESDVPYDGHHIQIYVADFSGPYRRLAERKAITEESDQHQYRFNTIFDPKSGEHLFTIEHEVRSMRHPLYNRPLVNRNPTQTNTDYVPGADALPWPRAERSTSAPRGRSRAAE
ncbi:MAG TPA: VOC family protein [Alphaproteobacteria bacterium]|nr:VOC family protein [Alphaproteobacteria bacterium]